MCCLAEMIYNEAEALCMLGGNETKVRSLLEEAVRPYQPGYSCTLSGDALLRQPSGCLTEGIHTRTIRW